MELTSNQKLLFHKNDEEHQKYAYVCFYCDYKGKDIKNLRAHLKSHKNGEKDIVEKIIEDTIKNEPGEHIYKQLLK